MHRKPNMGDQVKDPRTFHTISRSSDTCAQSPRGFEISTPRHRVRNTKIYIVPRRARPSRDQVANSCRPASYSPDRVSVNQALEALDVQIGLNHSGLTLPEAMSLRANRMLVHFSATLRSLIQATAWLYPDVQSHRSERSTRLMLRDELLPTPPPLSNRSSGFQAHLVALASSVVEEPWTAGQKSSQLDLVLNTMRTILDIRDVSTLLRRRRRSPSQRLPPYLVVATPPAYASAAAGEHRRMPIVALLHPSTDTQVILRGNPVPQEAPPPKEIFEKSNDATDRGRRGRRERRPKILIAEYQPMTSAFSEGPRNIISVIPTCGDQNGRLFEI
ncbi:hypothetical protein B0H14DRAFT_2592553 [Mycena olivaceomarginata]|nr:hypothetical protein B0H14DRAFT_2592553 [Mycena olivaceomarginata]